MKRFLLLLILILALILRFNKIGQIPPSLHADELAIAYNAYSISVDGKDEHGQLLPVSLRSFGDWKPALDAYLMAPIIKIFGLNNFAVRLPNAILSVISVLLVYLIITEIFVNYKFKNKLSLMSALLISFSPWHLHLSRSAIPITSGLFFILLGIYLFLKGTKNKPILYIFSISSFTLSLYAYISPRTVSPGLCLLLILLNKNWIFRNIKWFLVSLLIGFLVILPLIIAYRNESNVVFGRVKTISVFYDKGSAIKIWSMQTQDGLLNIKPIISRLFHNKPYIYAANISQRFFSHFNPSYLVIRGDKANPFNIPNMGIVYLIDYCFLIIGIYFLLKLKSGNKIILFVWLFLSILPASLTYQTPTVSRTLNAVPVFMILIASGLLSVYKKFEIRKLTALIFVFIYYSSFFLYMNNYYKVLPVHFASDWGYGFEEVNNFINTSDTRFNKIIFLPNTSPAYIYLLYLNKYPPQVFRHEAIHDFTLDRFGYEHVSSFNKYTFLRNENTWDNIKMDMKPGELYIGREEEIKSNYKQEILFPDGKVAFRIAYL